MMPPLPWFRTFTTIVEDPALQRLSSDLFRRYFNLYALAARSDDRGWMFVTEETGWVLRDSTDQIKVDLVELRERGLFVEREDGAWSPTRFEEEQRISDHSTERVKRHRQKKLQKKPGETVSPRFTERKGTALDTDTDLEKEKKKKKKKKQNSSAVDESSDAYRLSKLLLDLLQERLPSFKAPKTLQGWAIDLDRAMRLDKRTAEDLEAVIRWGVKDDFWGSNLLSGKAIRKHFDKVNARRMSPSGNGRYGGGTSNDGKRFDHFNERVRGST